MPVNMKWSFANIWNEALEKGRPDRPFKKRETLWASELGGAMVDRYFKYIGEEASNPPNKRSLRKFEAGNIWEWIIILVLKRAGLFIEEQRWVKYTHSANGKTFLPVTGRIDVIAGGKPDWERSKAEVHSLELPEFIDRATDTIIEHFKNKFPNGLVEIPLEIKSLSSFMFERYLVLKRADPRHEMQLFHYLVSEGRDQGHLVYISRDDCRLLEMGVINPGPIRELYTKDIEQFSWYIFKGEQPPKEKEIVFQEALFKFSQNYKVGYSNYLTKLYGYKNQMEFENKYKPLTARWNRVLNRYINGENITDNNKVAAKEIKAAGFNLEKIVEEGKKLKQKGLIEPEKEVA